MACHEESNEDQPEAQDQHLFECSIESSKHIISNPATICINETPFAIESAIDIGCLTNKQDLSKGKPANFNLLRTHLITNNFQTKYTNEFNNLDLDLYVNSLKNHMDSGHPTTYGAQYAEDNKGILIGTSINREASEPASDILSYHEYKKHLTCQDNNFLPSFESKNNSRSATHRVKQYESQNNADVFAHASLIEGPLRKWNL